jgi:seipin
MFLLSSLDLPLPHQDAALKPISVAFSRRARRAYLSTALFSITALLLLGIASTAYVVFYLSYVPIRGFTQPVYFQFDADTNPYAYVLLRKGYIVTDQPYDVTVSLYLPRTPINTAAGNFMIDLQLLSPDSAGPEDKPLILARERRPAILTYYSPGIEYLQKILRLPLYALGWRREAEIIDLVVMEDIEFARGWRNIPINARLELSNARHLQVYDATLSFRARLRGLR